MPAAIARSHVLLRFLPWQTGVFSQVTNLYYQSRMTKIGSAVLDDDGKPLWNTRKGHPDACYVADVDPARPGRVLVGGNTGIWRSTDGGASWTQVTPAGGYPNLITEPGNACAAMPPGTPAFSRCSALMVAALKMRPAVLAPFVTRPAEKVIDRSA